MSYEDPIDATGYDYEKWVRFAFDHPVSKTPWYYTEEMHYRCDPNIVIRYYTRLFRGWKPARRVALGRQYPPRYPARVYRRDAGDVSRVSGRASARDGVLDV